MSRLDLEARLAGLEVRAMHQDRVIEDLNAAITAQWRLIDNLTSQIANLGDRIREASAAAPIEAQPPHY